MSAPDVRYKKKCFVLHSGLLTHSIKRAKRNLEATPCAYVKDVAKGEVLRKRLQLHANLRVWRARFAGSDTGAMVVSIEYPSLAVLAQEEAKGLTDPGYAA